MSADPLIAVLGADSPVGELLIDALADAGHARRAVLAVNAADIDDDLPDGIAAACADGSVSGAAARLATLARQGVAALGLNDGGEDGWPVMVAADDPLPSQRLQLASSGWVVLAKLLRPLHVAFGVNAVTASVMQPASERGSAALEILGQQTAAVLNFRDPPAGVYPQRIAFNTLPVALAPERHAAAAAVFWSGAERRIQLQCWDVPVFVGLSISVFITLESDTIDAAAVCACLAKIPGVVVSDVTDEVPSPVTLMASDGGVRVRDVHVAERRLQLAVVADNLGIGAAEPAARLLRRLCGSTVR